MNLPAAIRVAAVSLALLCSQAPAAPTFVNALVIEGSSVDASGGTAVNDGRLGFFSDLYYDPRRDEWWALSDRGPGGGTLPYETRVHRFRIDVDRRSGAIGNFQVIKTFIFRAGGAALDGFAPAEGGELGFAFDPEGIAIDPRTGHLYVSDEYGPTLAEFTHHGRLIRRFETPAGLVPRNAATTAANFANDNGNTAGKRSNRGFEGLAISPDGRHVWAMLQSAMLDEGGGNGTLVRLVRFDTHTARATGQFAYRLEGSSQGRGISALVALNESEFLVLERNNRGLGVDGNLAAPNKKVFRISLEGATDVSNVDLDDPAAVFTPVRKDAATPWLDLAAATPSGDAQTTALGPWVPEKWEGLAIGPRLADGSHLVLAGTDNDYSVTQNGSGVQFDVYFKADGSPVRIQCDIGTRQNCSAVNPDGSPGGALPATFDTSGYRLIPGVLHAYKASAADLAGYKVPGRPHRDGHRGDDDRRP